MTTVRHPARGSSLDAIRAAAVDLFARQGYEVTSVRQVVEAAGVTKGALYHHFKAKEDLLFGIYDRLLTLQQERLEAIAAEDRPPREILAAAAHDLVCSSIDSIAEAKVFMQSQHLLSTEREAEVRRRRRTYNELFESLIKQGQNDGGFRTDIPLSLLATGFFASVHYLGVWYSPGGEWARDAMADYLTELFLASLRQP